MKGKNSKDPHLIFIGTFLSVLLLFPISALAVVGAVEIVAGQEGQPVPETTISIFKQDELIIEEKTDNNGLAMIPLEEGEYKIVLKSPDKTIESTITVEPGKLLSLTGNFARGVITVNKWPVGRYRPLKATTAQRGYSVSSADLDGLMSYNFTTPQGSIYYGIPYYTSPGETISWNALLFADGNESRKLKKMKDYQIRIGDKIFSLKGATRWTMTAVQKTTIALLSKNGKKTLIEISINIRIQAAPSADKPLVTTAEWPVCIPGKFDGNAANTQAQFGGSPIEIKAETTTSVIINPPQKLVGMQKVIITDAGTTTEDMVRNVSLELFADKLKLHRGEGTQVHLNILGLAGMEKPAYVHLYNLSTSVVTMSAGNSQFFIINPGDESAGGTVSYNRNLVGIRRGDFTIIAILHAW